MLDGNTAGRNMSRSQGSFALTSDMALRDGEQRSDKPMEDCAAALDGDGIYVVCDGVTRTAKPGAYPNPSPATLAANLAMRTVLAHLQVGASSANPKRRLLDSLESANAAIAELNAPILPKLDYLENDLVGTVLAVCLRSGRQLHYAYIGDCWVRLLREGQALLLTPPQTAGVAAYRKQLTHGVDPIVAVRRNLRNRGDAADGYGCLTGEPSAMDFVRLGFIELQLGDRIIVATDGVNPAFDGEAAAGSPHSATSWVEAAVQREAARNRSPDDMALVQISVV
jgi:serine/threonine protein phosphatase PrpC